jgi:hypothetical protein
LEIVFSAEATWKFRRDGFIFGGWARWALVVEERRAREMRAAKASMDWGWFRCLVMISSLRG